MATGRIVDLTHWTPIAVQIETISGFRWRNLEGAPLTLRQAGRGRLLKALRREGDATYVVVKLARMRT